VVNFKALLAADNGHKNFRAGRYFDRLSYGKVSE